MAKAITGKKGQNKEENTKILKIEVTRIHRSVDPDSALKAWVDIRVEDVLVIKGLKVVETERGIFVAMPQKQGSNGKYYDQVFPATKTMRAELNEVVLTAFEKEPVAAA